MTGQRGRGLTGRPQVQGAWEQAVAPGRALAGTRRQ